MNLKNSGDSTGFEPMTSVMPVQCSNQLSHEVTQLRAGQFVGLMLKEMLYELRCLKSNEDMILVLAGQFKQSYLHLIFQFYYAEVLKHITEEHNWFIF